MSTIKNSAFLNFLLKEWYHIVRDKLTLVVLIGMPLAQLILFGYAIRTEINSANIGIIDLSRDKVTIDITNKLIMSKYFKQIDCDNDIKSIQSNLKNGKADLFIVFGQNTELDLYKTGKAKIQIIADASNPNLASTLVAYASGIIRNYQSELNNSANMKSFGVSAEVRMLYNPEMKSVFTFVPGLLAFILMLVTALMTSISITREKERGTMEILLASPLKPILIILGKVVPYIFLSLLNAITILIFSILVFGIAVQGAYIDLLVSSLVFIITGLSLGILISSSVSSMQVAMMISLVGLMLPTMLLSGFIFPIENMPWALQWFSHLIPAKWYLLAIKGIILKGQSLAEVANYIGILGAMTLFFLLISLKIFKTRLE